MADVEPKRVDGPVVEQTVAAPRPSPDEAIISTGDDTVTTAKPAAEATPTLVVTQPTSDEPSSGDVVVATTVVPDSGIVVTAEPVAPDRADKGDKNEAMSPTNGLSTSPSTLHNNTNDDDGEDGEGEDEDEDEDTKTDEPAKESAEPAVDDVEMQETTEVSTCSANDTHAKSFDLDLLRTFPESLEIPHLDVDVPELPTNGEIEVDGGVWHPTFPEDGISPRIEAFAKLEFGHGQDFYLGCTNIVLGRVDKDPGKAARIQRRRNSRLNLGAVNADEIKVPVLTPPGFATGSVSRRHVRIMYNFDESVWEATALCSNGFRRGRGGKYKMYGNGESCQLNNTDEVKFGTVTFTFLLPQDESENHSEDHCSDVRDGELYDQEAEVTTPRGRKPGHPTISHESEDGDDEDEESEADSREQSSDPTISIKTPKAGSKDALEMPPPPVNSTKRGRGRPPKNGISVREQKLLKRKAQEEFIANGGNIANLDLTKYAGLPVDKMLAKEGERMQMQVAKEALKKRKALEKEAKDREKKAIKDSKPPKATKERKRKRSKSPPPREEDYTPEQLVKPLFPYTVLIWEAIEASEKKALSLPEIYKSIEDKYPYFKIKAETTGWQSSVRHNLRGSNEGGSTLFRRGEKAGKGFIWENIEGADIDKERRKRKPGTSASIPSTHTVPSGGNWGPTTGSASQPIHSNALGQQYQPHPTGAVQAFAPKQEIQYAQGGPQVQAPTAPLHVAAPMAPSAPIPSVVPHGQAHNGASAPPLPEHHQPVAATRPATQAAVPPPPSWNPSQTKSTPMSTSASTNGNTHVPLTQHVRHNGVMTQVQHTTRQSHVATAGTVHSPNLGASMTGALGSIPPPPTAVSKPSTNAGDNQALIQSALAKAGTVSSELDSRARDLLDNPTFVRVMRSYLANHPNQDLSSPEVRKSLWAEFRSRTGKKPSVPNSNTQTAATPIPPAAKSPAAAVPQTQAPAPQPTPNTTASVPTSNGAPVTLAKPAATVAPSPAPAPAQPPAVQPGQAKPGTPATLPHRASNLLKTLPMDAKKRAELLQVLKNAKEKKAAEAKGSPVTGIKRPAEATEGAPVAKRTAIEGKQ